MSEKKELAPTSIFQDEYSDSDKLLLEAFQADSRCEIVAFFDSSKVSQYYFLNVFYFGQSEIGKMYCVLNPNQTLELSKSEEKPRIASHKEVVETILRGARLNFSYSTKKGVERLEQLILAHEEKNRAALESFVFKQITLNASYLKLYQIANMFLAPKEEG